MSRQEFSVSVRKAALKREPANKTHGKTHTPEHVAWRSMKTRCDNKRASNYHLYGARGITVCARWRASFETFLSDMGERPSADHSLDRIDTNKDYSPENCRWATRSEQMRNVRYNRIIEFRGKRVPLCVAVEALGLKYKTVYARISRGKTIEEALQ